MLKLTVFFFHGPSNMPLLSYRIWFKWCLHCTLTSRSSTHALQMKPLLHNTASGENTAWLSLALILDACYTVKAMLVSWTRGGCGPHHSNSKAWQNDYSLVSSSKTFHSVSVNSLSCCSRTSSTLLKCVCCKVCIMIISHVIFYSYFPFYSQSLVF